MWDETGKKDCQIIDLVDTVGQASDLVSTPTLFGLYPSEIIDGNILSFPSSQWILTGGSLEALANRTQDSHLKGENTSLEVPFPVSVVSVDYNDPFALIGECCGTSPVVHWLSSLAWVSAGGEVRILECVRAGCIFVGL